MASDILKKYMDMANTRGDFNTINNANFMLPTMGEMVQEDLMNEILQQYVDNDSNNDFNNQEYLDAAFYVEQPFSTELGYHSVEAAFVLKARALAQAKDEKTWQLNKYDGDTTAFLVNDINDGGQGFSFNDGKSYRSFKDYYKKMGGSSSLTIRHAGLDAPELPHFEIQAVPKHSEKFAVKEMTYKEMKDLANRNNTVYYVKYPTNKERTKVIPRKDDAKVKLLKVENDNKIVYYEIVDTPNRSTIPDANDNFNYYTVLGKEDGTESNKVIDAYNAQRLIREKLSGAKDILLVVDANQLSIHKTTSMNKTFNSLYYMTDAIEFLIGEWEKSYKDLPETSYSYAPYGMDKYSRSMGVLYIQETTPDGTLQWINLNKYILAKTKEAIANPDFNSSPELQEMKNGLSEAFNLWSYDKDNIEWLDSFNKLTAKSYQEKLNYHKHLTGIDFTQERNCALMLGDTLMLMPPESIRNVTQVNYERLPNMRSKGTMAKQMGQNEHMLELDLYFYGDIGINGIMDTIQTPNGEQQTYWMNGLRSLVAQFKIAPYLPIENGYINDVLGIEAVSLMNMNIQTVKGFPKLLKVVLSLREFNYRTFMPDLPVDTNYGEIEGQLAHLNPLFAKCFNWEIFRYYYQRAIQEGDKLSTLDYASYDYNLQYYTHKNTIGPWGGCPPKGMGSKVDFYIPDENWLEQALALKKERDSNPLTNFAGVDLSTNANMFLLDLEELNKKINDIKNHFKASNGDANIFDKNVSDMISQHGKGDRILVADIPSFKFTENPDKDHGVYTRNITDSLQYSSVYIRNGRNKINKKEFQEGYVAQIHNAYRDIINNSAYMTGMNTNEAIRWVDRDKEYKVTWEFCIKLNTANITDDDLINIREVLSKDAGIKMEQVFKDGEVKVCYSMRFKPTHINMDGTTNDVLGDLSGKGGTSAILVAGGKGEYPGTDSFVFEASYDTQALGGIRKVIDGAEGPATGENPSNSQNEAIDFFIQDYKNPANMPFVPYIRDVYGESIGATLSNSFTDISLKAIEGVGPQYLGGQDTMIELNLVTDDMVIVSALNNLPTMASAMAKRYKRVLPAWPVKIRSSMTDLLGVSEVLIDAIEVSTVEGFPGVYSIAMRLTSVDRTQRQREALRRLDVAPNGGNVDYNGHSNLAIKNYFSIEQALANAELYPDLDIPSLKELGKLGYRFVKYAGSKRVYPDPDFYIVYNYPYTSLIIKKLVKDSISKQLLSTEEHPEGEHLQKFTLKDTLGAEITAKVEQYTGLMVDGETKGVAKNYDDILIEQRKTVQKKLKNMKNVKENQRETIRENFELGNILKYLTMCDVNDGWEIRPGWRAPLCEESTNDAIREDATNVKDNAYAKEIKEIRKKALRLIDNILLKPINDYGDLDNGPGYTPLLTAEVVNKMFAEGDGKALMELLFPTVEIKPATVSKGSEMLGTGDSVIFNKKYFKTPTPLNFLVGYTYASGCALSGHEEFRAKSAVDKWAPNHHCYSEELTASVYAEDEKHTLMPYCVEDRIAGGSKLSTRVDSAIKNGTVFGAFRITKYSSSTVVAQIGDRTDTTIMYGGPFFDSTYKDKNDEDKGSKQRIKPGFLDPYYNYTENEKVLEDYKKKILLSKKANTEAFLRNMLVQLRKLILDGLFISEIDIIARDFDKIYAELNPRKMTEAAYSGPKDQAEGKTTKDTDMGAALRQLGFKPEEMEELLNSMKDANIRSLCARMVYPFLTCITKSSGDIYSTLKFRDYNALNALTGYVEGGDQNSESRSTVIKFLSALAGIDLTLQKEGKNESSVSNSQKLINNMMKDVYIASANDPRAYILHSFYDMLVNDKRGRLARAFPTYYVVFVDEGRKVGSWKLHDNFYNMNSIGEIQVVKSRKIAADTCSITMNNMFNSYTREPDITTTQQYVDIYGLRDVFDSIFSPQIYFDKEKRIRLRQTVPDKVVLQPGIRIHVRMGYTADGSKLPIIFNGKVAEVEVGDVCQIVAQGDGHELMNPLNAFGEIEVTSLDPSQDPITWFKDIRGSLSSGGETPRDLLAKLLTAKFGGWKKITNIAFDGRWFNENPFGITHFGDPKFTNIFEKGEVTQNLYEVSDETLLKDVNELYTEPTAKKMTPIVNTSLQDKTFWDLLHLCANTGIEYIGAVRDFGFRSTIFLGKPNHYYAYAYELVDNKVIERRKPFQQYHYYDSYNDIIYNSIKASEAQMKTNAVGLWQSSSAWWGREQSTVGPIYLDMNIYPEYQKSMTVDTGLLAAGNGGIDIPFVDHFAEEWNLNPNDDKVNKSTAWRVTANALKNSVKDMYQGDIGVIGDPSVKPYDRCYIYDTYEDMMGMFEVEAVVHTMSVETGFTTSIMPDVIARHEDKLEPAVQGLMSSIGAVTSLTVAGNVAETLWTFGVNNKLVTTMAKSKSMYGVGTRLNKFAGDLGHASGMQSFLEKHPAAKNLFSTLSFNPIQTDLDLRRMTGLIDELAEMTIEGALKPNMSLFVNMFSKYNDIDIDALQNSMKQASLGDKYGVNKNKIKPEDMTKAFDDMIKEKKALDGILDTSKLNLSQFGKDLLGNDELMKSLKYETKITEQIVNFATNDVEVDAKTLKQFSDLLSNSKVQNVVSEGKVAVSGLDELFTSFKSLFDNTSDGKKFKAVKNVLKGGDIIENLLMVVRGVFKFNWATLLIDIALSTIVHIFTKDAQSMFTRWIQGIQAIDVYPLKRNGKPLIAGMNGNKGSVAGYPVQEGYDSIQGMVMQFVDGVKGLDGGLPFMDWILEAFVDKGVLENLSKEWRRDLGIDNPEDTGALDETGEDFKQNVYNTVSSAYAANANHAYAIMTKYRKLDFNTKGRTDETYKYYEIKGVTASNIASNPKVQKLYYINRDDDIWKAITDDRLVVAHSKSYTNLVTIPFESGNEKVPVAVKNNIIDTPLLQEDALYILKCLVTDESLKKGTIHFKSGARLNDVDKTWKNTGFAFTVEYKGLLGFDGTMRKALDKIQQDTRLSDNNMFAYQESGSKFMITVYPPVKDTKLKDRKGDDKNE